MEEEEEEERHRMMVSLRSNSNFRYTSRQDSRIESIPTFSSKLSPVTGEPWSKRFRISRILDGGGTLGDGYLLLQHHLLQHLHLRLRGRTV